MAGGEKTCGPMSYKKAGHLLSPIRKLLLSPAKLAGRLCLDRRQQNVLELGPGPGFFSTEVARQIPHGTLTLVDVQKEMLDMAQKRLDSFGLYNIKYVQADAVALPFEADTFDAAFLVAVLGEVSDKQKCISELYRVLQPGGLLSVTEQFGGHHFISLDELKKLAGEMFSLEKIFGKGRNYTANFRKQVYREAG